MTLRRVQKRAKSYRCLVTVVFFIITPKIKMKRKANLEDYGFIVEKRPRTGYHISDLPNEMMQKIFNYLLPSTRQQIGLVCIFWMELMTEYFPDDNRIVVNGHMDFSPVEPLYQTFHARMTTPLTKRIFPGLKIHSFPKKSSHENFINFIKLIGDEVRHLKIDSFYGMGIPKFDICQNLYSHLPQLETLTIGHEKLLGDLTFPPSLKSIEIEHQLTKIEQINALQKIKNLETFKTKTILMAKKDLNNKPSFIDPTMENSLLAMFGDDGSNTIELTTSFNYCTEDKLLPKDVHEMSLHVNEINISPLAKFTNLKHLKLLLPNGSVAIQPYDQKKYFGINRLEIRGTNTEIQTLDQLLKSFPDMEYVTFMHITLRDCDFSTVCEHMPKLKGFCYGSHQSMVSLRNVFATGHFSLKDLKFLESFYTCSKPESYNYLPNFQWPDLPRLKTLNLNGEGCRFLNWNFYNQVSQKSPNLNTIRIGYDYENDYIERNSSKFFPILSLQGLTALSLPGEGNSIADTTRNADLIENIMQRCTNLESFYFIDRVGLTLKQEVNLFKRLPKLEVVTSASQDLEIERDMWRYHVTSLKPYLKDNLHLYKDVDETLRYLFNFHIPCLDRIAMEKSYAAMFRDEFDLNLKIRYIVAHDFLELSFFEMCKSLYSTQLT